MNFYRLFFDQPITNITNVDSKRDQGYAFYQTNHFLIGGDMIVIYDSQDEKIAAAIREAHAARNEAFAKLFKAAVAKIKNMILAPAAYVKASALSAAH